MNERRACGRDKIVNVLKIEENTTRMLYFAYYNKYKIY